MIGEVGQVRKPLAPDGMIYLLGEHWTATLANVTAETPAVPIGATVRVTGIQGLRLFVEPESDITWVPDPLIPATPSGDDVLPVTGGVRYLPSNESGEGESSS